jgi:alpha-glucosidase
MNPEIIFDISPDFISPFYPKRGETVELSLMARGELDEILLQGMFAGTSRTLRFEKGDDLGGGWHRYALTLSFPETRLYFHLVYRQGNEYRYLSQAGITPHPPAERAGWLLLFDFEAPEWVTDSVFYQIFPDRFRKGNPSVGVRDGEYEFDGGVSREVPWDSVPLEWEEGRCVDFYNGDLDGIIDAIPHFRELGINALYLNPIFHSRTHHRYDSIDFFAVDPHLGGNEALARLSAALREAGIRLVLDISINHSGSDHPWFTEGLKGADSREYYYIEDDGSYEAWYGFSTLPQLNYGSEKLRGRIWKDQDSVIKTFLKPPYSIDGWRFDVANQTGRNDRDNYCDEIWREVRKAIKEEGPDKYILAEHWDDASDSLTGDHWDAVMNYFGCSRPIRAWLGELDRYLTHPDDYPPKTTVPLSNREFANFLEQSIRSLPSQIRHFQFNVLDSHDIGRLHNTPGIFSRENLKAALLVQFMLPGTPVVYYGDEILLDGHVNSTEGIRFPMQWDREGWDQDSFKLYRELIELRKNNDSLKTGGFAVLAADEDVLVISRYTGTQAVLAAFNRNLGAVKRIVSLAALPPSARDSDEFSLNLHGLESRIIHLSQS